MICRANKYIIYNSFNKKVDVRTFRKVVVPCESEAKTIANDDIKQQAASQGTYEETKEEFNVTNLAQRGSPTYVDFKSKEEYSIPNNSERGNNNKGNEDVGEGKMSKLKSLFNTELKMKNPTSKSSIKKWLSFSKIEGNLSSNTDKQFDKARAGEDMTDNIDCTSKQDDSTNKPSDLIAQLDDKKKNELNYKQKYSFEKNTEQQKVEKKLNDDNDDKNSNNQMINHDKKVAKNNSLLDLVSKLTKNSTVKKDEEASTIAADQFVDNEIVDYDISKHENDEIQEAIHSTPVEVIQSDNSVITEHHNTLNDTKQIVDDVDETKFDSAFVSEEIKGKSLVEHVSSKSIEESSDNLVKTLIDDIFNKKFSDYLIEKEHLETYTMTGMNKIDEDMSTEEGTINYLGSTHEFEDIPSIEISQRKTEESEMIENASIMKMDQLSENSIVIDHESNVMHDNNETDDNTVDFQESSNVENPLYLERSKFEEIIKEDSEPKIEEQIISSMKSYEQFDDINFQGIDTVSFFNEESEFKVCEERVLKDTSLPSLNKSDNVDFVDSSDESESGRQTEDKLENEDLFIDPWSNLESRHVAQNAESFEVKFENNFFSPEEDYFYKTNEADVWMNKISVVNNHEQSHNNFNMKMNEIKDKKCQKEDIEPKSEEHKMIIVEVLDELLNSMFDHEDEDELELTKEEETFHNCNENLDLNKDIIDPFTDKNSINLFMQDQSITGFLFEEPVATSKYEIPDLTPEEKVNLCEKHSLMIESPRDSKLIEKNYDKINQANENNFVHEEDKTLNELHEEKDETIFKKENDVPRNKDFDFETSVDATVKKSFICNEENEKRLPGNEETPNDHVYKKEQDIEMSQENDKNQSIDLAEDVYNKSFCSTEQETVKDNVVEDVHKNSLLSTEQVITTTAIEDLGTPNDELKQKSLKKKLKTALSFKKSKTTFQNFLNKSMEVKFENKTEVSKKSKSKIKIEKNRSSWYYDSEFFPKEARTDHHNKSNIKRSFSLTMLKSPASFDIKKKFHTLGRKVKPPSSVDLESFSSSLSAHFPKPAPESDLDNFRVKLGQSTFYLLSDGAPIENEIFQNRLRDEENIISNVHVENADEFVLNPLEVNEEAFSDIGSDCIDGDIDPVEETKVTDSELFSVTSDSDPETDYFSAESNESIDQIEYSKSFLKEEVISFEECHKDPDRDKNSKLTSDKVGLIKGQVRYLSKSLDDISMLRLKKKKFSVSNESVEKSEPVAFASIDNNALDMPRNLSSSHPHLYSENGNSLLILNNNSNKTSWKPLKKLKKIFKSSSKLSEADVYNDTYLQKKIQVNQNPIYIASPEEELQEVTGFPNHQTPFSRQSLGTLQFIT